MKRLIMITILFAGTFSASMCGRAPADTTTLSESTSSLTTATTTTTTTSAVTTCSGVLTTGSNYTTSGLQTSSMTTDTMTTDTTDTIPTISTEYTTTLSTEGTTTTSPTTATTTTPDSVTTFVTVTQTITLPTTSRTDTISEIYLQLDGALVRVTGVVYYVIATPERPAYYVYDGTGTILVIDDNPVAVGDGIVIEASFDTDEPSPQLINVTSLAPSTAFTTLPTYETIAFADLVSHFPSDLAFHGRTVLVTGVVGTSMTPMGPIYYLSDAGSPALLVINGKSFMPSGYNPFATMIGSTVTIEAVIHAYLLPDAQWHVLVANEADPGDVPDFLPGEGGAIPEIPEFTAISGKFGGFYLDSIDRSNDGFGGVDDILNVSFPLPSEFGATSYTLEYYDTDLSAWATFQYQGSDLIATGDNLSLVVSESLTLRLRINDGDQFNQTSNEVSYTLSGVDTYFSGWSLDSSMYLTGIMYPGIGYGVSAEFTVRDLDNVVVEGYLTYQWFRVNPLTFEMTPIPGATSLQYVTTSSDMGYHLMIQATGDGVHVGGVQQVIHFGDILPMNEAYATNASIGGFTLNLYYTVPGLNPSLLQVWDDNFNPVTILGVVPGDNLGQYVITLDPGATTPTSYSVSYYGDWVLQSQAEEGFMHQMLTVVVTATE